MDKTEKVTKDPKRVEAACKGREKYMNKLKESILNDAKKVAEILPMQAMKPPALPTPPPPLPPVLTTPPPQDQMILMSMALVCLQSLPPVFVYCLPITLFSLLKNSSMIAWRLSMYKNNHQKYVIYFRKIYNKWVLLIGKKNIEDSLKNGIIITIGATGIFFGQKTLNIVKPPKISKLGIMDIMTLTSGICWGVFMKDYAVYKKWVNEWYNKNFITLNRVIKLTQHRPSNSCLCCFTFQLLKSHHDWWHSGGPLHLQG